MSADPVAVRVRGAATAEELAAVLAVLGPRPPAAEDPYRRWRRVRQGALRAVPGREGRLR